MGDTGHTLLGRAARRGPDGPPGPALARTPSRAKVVPTPGRGPGVLNRRNDPPRFSPSALARIASARNSFRCPTCGGLAAPQPQS